MKNQKILYISFITLIVLVLAQCTTDEPLFFSEEGEELSGGQGTVLIFLQMRLVFKYRI